MKQHWIFYLRWPLAIVCFVGYAATVFAQTCNQAVVTQGAGTMNISLAGCGGAPVTPPVVVVPPVTPPVPPVTHPGSPDVSIDGFILPQPSKRPTSIAPATFHGGLNGAGPEMNAYAMNPSRCNTSPPLTRSWQHDINFAEYKIGAVDNFVLKPGESLTYKFVVGQTDTGGGFNYGESAQSGGNIRPAFMTVTSNPCDFDATQVGKNSCYQSGINGVMLVWANITGQLPASYCRLVKGQTYYFNIRFQDIRPGIPLQDSCTGSCGGAIQVS